MTLAGLFRPTTLVCGLVVASLASAATPDPPAGSASGPNSDRGPRGEAEVLTFIARWMGLEAGLATATTVIRGDTREVTVTARNAAWLDPLYPIDDRMVSTGHLSGGASRYQTWFREGRFQQDQDMVFTPVGEHVERRQLVDGEWRTSSSDWTNHVDAGVPVVPEDPISAFYRIREANLPAGSALRLSVYNGRRVVPVVATCLRRDAAQGDEALRFISVRSAREGDFEGGIDLYLTDANVPALAILQTKAGPVRIEVTR